MTASLADRLDAALPQTQCTRCGYPDCRSYAEAIADGGAMINRCPPGGEEGIARLSTLSGQVMLPLDTECGEEGPRHRAVIDEAACIGCTLCIEACPVDCIVGAPKRMHTVIDDWCTGCELCLPVCPVDCIDWEPITADKCGWQAWSAELAEQSRARYAAHRARVQQAQRDEAARLQALSTRRTGSVD